MLLFEWNFFRVFEVFLQTFLNFFKIFLTFENFLKFILCRCTHNLTLLVKYTFRPEVYKIEVKRRFWIWGVFINIVNIWEAVFGFFFLAKKKRLVFTNVFWEGGPVSPWSCRPLRGHFGGPGRPWPEVGFQKFRGVFQSR